MTTWMTSASGLEALRRVDETVAEEFFNNPTAYVIGAPPVGWPSNPVTSWKSYAAYSASTNPGLPGAWVMYDNESWTQTPQNEQNAPKTFMGKFIALAHQRGQFVICAPARDLMAVPTAFCSQQSGETLDAAYLRCRLPAAAEASDVFHCQAQADQGSVGAFQSLVGGARSQLTSGHTLWAGLTTMRGDPVQAMVDCYHSVMNEVHGYWLNISTTTGQVATDFLNAI